MHIESLIREFRKRGTRESLLEAGKRVSHIDLYESIQKNIEKLKSLDARFIFLSSDYSKESISFLLALLSLNKVVCPIPPDFMLDEQFDYLGSLGGDLVVTIQEGEESFFSIEKREIPPILNTFYESKKPGLVVLTSGSSGSPKAALYDFESWLGRFDFEQDRPDSRSPLFLKFNHLGGLQTLFSQLSCGGVSVLLKSRRPEEIIKLLLDNEITFLPVTPSFLSVLDYHISHFTKGLTFSSVSLVTLGAEPVHEKSIKNVHQYFPNAKVIQTYGLTETGTLKTKTVKNNPSYLDFDCDVNQYRVVEGRLEVKSPYMMIGFLNAESPFSDDGFLKTGDSVELKDKTLRIIGRMEDRINVGGEKVSPLEIEEVILMHPMVIDAVVFAKPHDMLGQVVCAEVVSTALTEKDLGGLKTFCLQYLEKYKVPVNIELVEKIALSNNFKKKR